MQTKSQLLVVFGQLTPQWREPVIGIDDGRAVIAQSLEYFAFCPGDTFEAAKAFKMGGGGIGNDGDGRFRQAGQIGNFPRVIGTRPKSVRGRPISLFRLPRVARVSPCWARILASISFTVVLPLLPVTASSGMAK